MPSPAQPVPRPAVIFAALSLLAAIAWLVSRVWVGLDFADEMQYYGEISSLTRTGRFFQDDLFLQQLGYVFVLPFFKLHALFFPDQSHLIMFGRLLLLAGYGLAGLLAWRTAGKHGGFSLAQKTGALALLLAWIPFQIFAISYNSFSYLIIIALAAVWLTRDPARFPRYAVFTAALLTVLTYTHPPAGLVLIVTATVEAAWRFGLRSAVRLIGLVAAGGLIVLGVMFALNGAGFLGEVMEAVNFSRAFGVADIIMTPFHLGGWLILLATGGIFLARIRLGRALPYPLGAATPLVLRWALLIGLVLGLSALLGLVANWKTGFFAGTATLLLLMLVAASLGPDDGTRPVLRLDSPTLLRWVMLIVLGGGLAVLFLLLVTSSNCRTGNFATTVFFTLLIILAAGADGRNRDPLTGLAVLGLVAGAVFAFTSGNGLPNFGVGAAALIPFLALWVGREPAAPGRGPLLAAGVIPLLALLLLANGMLSPYREQFFWKKFLPVEGVPAFAGLRTSPLKVSAIGIFQRVSPRATMQGKRLLVTGSHPWLYFVLGGEPTTPILFMKFDGKPEAYELAVQRLARMPAPDVVVITEPFMPPPLARWLSDWTKPGITEQVLPLPADFTAYFQYQTGGVFAPQVFILSRTTAPAHP